MAKQFFVRVMVVLAVLAIPVATSGVTPVYIDCTPYTNSEPRVVDGQKVCAGTGAGCYECVVLSPAGAVGISGVASNRWLAYIDVADQLNALPTAISY